MFLRAEADKNGGDRTTIDPEAVTSQIQLVLSRDLAREVIKKEKLDEQSGVRSRRCAARRCLKSVLSLFGIGRDPAAHDEGRAHARSVLRPAQRLRGGKIPRHWHRLPLHQSRSRRPRRQQYRRDLPQDAANGQAGSNARGRRLVGRGNRQSAHQGGGRRSQGRGLSRQNQSVCRRQQYLAADPAADRNQFADCRGARPKGRSGGEGAAIARTHPLGQADRILPTLRIPNPCVG